MKHYWDTMEQMTDRDEITEFLRRAGLRNASHKIYPGCF